MKHSSGFTLVETSIVVIIVGILLSATFSLGFDYVKTMRVKTDKEQMANVISDGMATARTSNYYGYSRYETLEIILESDSTTSQVVGGDISGAQRVDWFDLLHSSLNVGSGVSQVQIDITPYQIGCDIYADGLSIGTGSLEFSLDATINDDSYCYRISQDVCKLNQIACS